MANKETYNRHYLLDMWYIFEMTQSEINELRTFLDNHPSVNLEFNTAENGDLNGQNESTYQNLTIERLADSLISKDIEPSRVRCGHFANSNLPMFRLFRPKSSGEA